jgi:hypothetical protein
MAAFVPKFCHVFLIRFFFAPLDWATKMVRVEKKEEQSKSLYPI